MRRCLVFNPQAGTADRIKDFLTHLTGEVRWEVRLIPTDDDVRRLGDDIREGAYDRLLLGGGDGTLSRIVRTLGPDFPKIDLAILPFGTGNDFARSLGVLEADLEDAFHRAVSEPAVAVDAIKMTSGDADTWLVNVANGGMGGKVAQDVSDQDKSRWGTMAYWIASVTAAVSPQPYEVRLTLDDETEEAELFGLAVANGRFVGGGFPIARHASIDDGWLDVTAVPVLHGLELVTAGIDFAREREGVRDRGLKTYRARRVEVLSVPQLPFSIDGEPVRGADAAFEVVPGALRMVPGRGVSALGPS